MTKKSVDYQKIKKFFSELRKIEDESTYTTDIIKDILLVSQLGSIGDKVLKTNEIHNLWVEKLNELSDILRNKYFKDVE